MSSKLFAHMFKGLVQQVGGVEAAAAAISATVGHPVSIGTVSKISNGRAEVPIAWAYALEDATGNFCFDAYRNRVVGKHGAEMTVASHLDVLRESTEAVQAIAHVESQPSTETIVRARKEVADVYEQLAGALAAYDAMLKERGAAE
ncbi:MAG: hypothetical protein CML69_15485 [Rhodobacteraceae bacterium]|nr:hypothetical protein [Paracoccaceae bacterium]